MHLYATFSKIDDTPDGLIVEGIASTETRDSEGDVVDYASLKAALPDYLQWANIREMHQPLAAGRALMVIPDDDARTVFLRALVVDSEAQKKVRAGVYKGFSIGGKGERKIVKAADGREERRAFVRTLFEISLVDRPANPDARFAIVKMEASMPPEAETQTPAPGLGADARAALERLAGQVAPLIQKAAADPSKIVAMIQQARNELELGGDMEGAALYTQAIALVQQAAGEAKETPEQQADEDAAGTEGTPADAQQDAQQAMLAAAKPGTIQKAGRAISGQRMSAMEQVWKTLGEMLAGAGNAKIGKAMSAYQGDTQDVAMAEKLAKAIGAELHGPFETLAKGVLALHDRLQIVEAQPAAGGPVLRRVEKVITGQPPAQQQAQKPAMSAVVREQADNLLRLSKTTSNRALAEQYRQQYETLKAQYE